MLFKILHGDPSNISLDVTPFHEGWAYVTHDGFFYIDLNIGTVEAPNNQRVKLNAQNAEALCGVSLDELKNEIATQDVVILHEAQAYTDAALAEIKESGSLKGEKGDDGYTPVRGTDYWTAADKAEIKSYVDDAILNGAW